jgi:hypothetical protein
MEQKKYSKNDRSKSPLEEKGFDAIPLVRLFNRFFMIKSNNIDGKR